MDSDYYKLTTDIDVREVLKYLNNLGIRNISGEVLKYFIADLKKLIKYDIEQMKRNEIDIDQYRGFERLHSASTFSSRVRSKNQNIQKCMKDSQVTRKPFSIRPTHSAPVLSDKKYDMPVRRACSCVKVEKKSETTVPTNEGPTSSKNLIKVTKLPSIKKSDPVSLYHYYSLLWAKYKTNVPGENDWADLRWQMRQKMAGNIIKQPLQNHQSRK